VARKVQERLLAVVLAQPLAVAVAMMSLMLNSQNRIINLITG
jgi:hypothetical protein